MKGINELIINQATMVEAVQFWLDSKMVQQAPRVLAVTETGRGHDEVFKVSLGDRSSAQPCGDGK